MFYNFKDTLHINHFVLVKECTNKNCYTTVVITFDPEKKQIQVNTPRGTMIRAIDFSYVEQAKLNPQEGEEIQMKIWLINDKVHLLVRMLHEYDLVSSNKSFSTLLTHTKTFFFNLHVFCMFLFQICL